MELEKNPKTRQIFKRLLELEDKVSGKPFPSMARVKQISSYACGPAVLEMLLSFVGVKVTQRSIIGSVRAWRKIKLFGFDLNGLAKASSIAGKRKFVFWGKRNSKISDLETIVNKYKWPVGVEWQGIFYEQGDEDNGHFAVVTKIDKTTGFLRIADPFFNGFFGYRGVDRKLKISHFVKRWWDTNEKKILGTSKTKTIRDTRLMFIITPRGTPWPKKIGMFPVRS